MPDTIEDRLDRLVASTPDDRVRRGVETLAHEIEHSRPRRRSLRSRFSGRAIAGASVIAAIGLFTATAAVAAPPVFAWLTFTPDASTTLVLESGMVCEAGFKVQPAFSREADEEAAVAAGREYLRTLDLATLPLAERMAEDDREGALPYDVTALSPEDLASSRVSWALSRLVSDGMFAELADRGITAGAALEGGFTCAAGPTK